ncbi:MAG: hypothetical protein H7Z12_15735 [Rhodospirillaceae bacterium]|nr:hypothetical protein [Rhodospirillales bacterium]
MNANRAITRYSGLLFGILLIALLWAAVLHQDRRMETIQENSYRLELTNYARLLEAHTRSIIRGLDQVVTHVKAEYEEAPNRFALKPLIDRSPILKGLSVQVGIIGADGFLLASTAAVPAGQRIDLSDREHFRVHAATDSGQLFISKPVLGRASGKWSIQIARRLNDARGGFAGVAVVSLNPDYLTDIYEKIDLGADSRILVVGEDGIVRAQASGRDRSVGQSFGDPTAFAELWARSEGIIHAISPIDQHPHVRAFRRLPDYPLMVMVSRPEENLHQLYAHERLLFVAAGWGGTALIALGALLLQWQVLRQHATERRLRGRETELSEARADLEHKNRDLAQFTEVLAHHLQEPVRLQHAFSQRLMTVLPTPLSEAAQQALQFVLDGAMRQRALLRDVQLYLSMAQLPPATKPCSGENALDVALDRLEHKLAESEADVQRGELPHVLMDQGRLADLFTILIDNAIEYRKPGTAAAIQIGAKPCGAMVEFWVSDNGIGIPDEYHMRVFRVFERLNPRRGDGGAGTGIGLALAKKIVESANGHIWVENAPGHGTSIHFQLAASEDHNA